MYGEDIDIVLCYASFLRKVSSYFKGQPFTKLINVTEKTDLEDKTSKFNLSWSLVKHPMKINDPQCALVKAGIVTKS